MINCLKDTIHVLMSVLLCKIQCLLICFCKPFSHIYTATSLRLENTPHKSLKTVVSATNDDEEVVDHVDGHVNDDVGEEEDDVVDAKEDESQSGGDTLTLKSSIRKVDLNSTEAEKKEKKKKVQWVDVMGIKELSEIREFERSEEDDTDSDRGKTCACVIL